MALEQHIDSLKEKHARIEQKLHQEETHPSADDSFVRLLKRQKLTLKDEIERLLQGQSIAA